MIPVQHLFWTVLVGVFGALVGSFLNVVVYRMPLGKSVVYPGSQCGACGTAIPAWHNLPIVSWLLLRGRAACCGAPFSVRYPLVEAATAALSVALWLRVSAPFSGHAPDLGLALTAWALWFTFAAVLLVIALIDFDTLRIPDILSLPLIPLGLTAAFFVNPITHVSIEQSLFGLLVGGGTLLVITYGYLALTGREGMGLGDYRLMAGVGAYLGWQSLLFILMASAVQGLVFAGLVKILHLDRVLPTLDDPDPEGFRDPAAPEVAPEDTSAPAAATGEPQMAVPFGPFIALAALEWLLFEPLWMRLFDKLVYAGLA